MHRSFYGRRSADLEWPPGRRVISRIISHISSPQDTPVQEVFSWLLAGHQLTVSGGPSSSSATLPPEKSFDWLIDWLNRSPRFTNFYRAMLCCRNVSVCPSRSGIIPKRLNISSTRRNSSPPDNSHYELNRVPKFRRGHRQPGRWMNTGVI